MNEKKYLAKIIAKDPNGLQVISACCSDAKVKVEEIKFLKKNKLFLLLIERLNKENDSKEKIKSVCKFEFVDDVKSKNIDQKNKNNILELVAINLFKAGEKFILSITENGYGKKTSHYDYRVTNRGGKGIIGIINSPRNGNISSSFPVFEGDEIMISTNKGRVIRIAVKEIRTAGRNTQGVRIIKLSGDEKVVSAIKIEDNLL